MKKLKGILSIVLAVAMLCTAFVFAVPANAADTAKASTGLEPKLQDKIENGTILHALCWSYADIEKNIPAIAAAGYSAVQTSPVQQPKDYSSSTNISGQWWKLYQPVSLALAKKSWVGTEAELKSLCTTAHQYGVKIVCDIVSNHLGADDDAGYSKLAKEVQTYDSQLWNGNGAVKGNPYFHQNLSSASDSNASAVTQNISSGCPDLNTGNTTVQNKVVSLLKQCIDNGVDGFRFDAAKHIETPSDSVSPNNYWTNVISQTNSYASSKGKEIFYYGEVLNTPGGGRSIQGYTNLNGGKYRITDNTTSNSIRNAVTGHNASSAINASYSLSGGATHAVLWAESHDTYLNTESGFTTNVSDSDIMKTWALVASRKDATPLYFARTDNMKMGTCSTNTSYKNIAVAEVNKFHNNFVGQAEKTGTSGSLAYVARGGKGIVIVNVNGNATNANVSGTGLANGSYKDMITGNTFTVNGGTVSGQIGNSGIAVVVQSDTTPRVDADVESGTFSGDTLTVGLSLTNATSGTYQLDNYGAIPFTGSPKIKIGSDYNYGDTITLNLTATDGKTTTQTTYKYTKKQAASSGVYIFLPQSLITQENWTGPFYCYIYDQDTAGGTKVGGLVYGNGAWPGEQLSYDASLNAYYLEVDSENAYAAKTLALKDGNVTSSESQGVVKFDLAHSKNAHVIVSDSSKSSGGLSQGKQFPGTGRNTLIINGVSKKFSRLSGTAGSSAWSDTTDKPGQQAVVPATEVKKGQVAPTTAPVTQAPTQAPTDKPTDAPTQAPTAAPTTIPGPTTAQKIYGDVNLDGKADIMDVTAIQKHLAMIETISAEGLALADVNGDGEVKIQDATCIQKHIAGMSDTGRAGQPYGGQPVVPTQAPTQAPTAAPTEAPTEAPTDPPAPGTYTLYIKTNLTWISSDGCEPYVYDNSTGQSYLMTKDFDAYPEVFTAEVPETVSDVSFYRALSEATPATGYNAIENLSVSSSNNCIVLYEAGKDGFDTILGANVEPYVPEEKPTDGVSTVYVKNTKGWSSVYIYGWGNGLNNQAYAMENIGDNVWKFDFQDTIYGDTAEFFLFKDTETGWVNQTGNLKLTDNNNFYDLNADTWSKYNG